MLNSLLIYFSNGQRTTTIAQFCPKTVNLCLRRYSNRNVTIVEAFLSTLDGERSRVLRNASFLTTDVEVYAMILIILAGKGSRLEDHFYPLIFAVGLIGCVETINHDESAAGKKAEEFAQIAFVKQDIENGYALLADGTKRYVSLEQFKIVISKLHPKAFPKTVTAFEYEPMPGEKAIYIFLTGENSGEHFYYRLTMEGTATTGYECYGSIARANPYPPSNEKKSFKQ